VIPPFKISAAAAVSHLLHSKYARESHAEIHNAGALDVTVYRCPSAALCVPGLATPPLDGNEYRPRPSRSCFYRVRLSYFDPAMKALGGSGTNWFSIGEWVDGITNAIWFPEGEGWRSEAPRSEGGGEPTAPSD
jgi:hypothetical protein